MRLSFCAGAGLWCMCGLSDGQYMPGPSFGLTEAMLFNGPDHAAIHLALQSTVQVASGRFATAAIAAAHCIPLCSVVAGVKPNRGVCVGGEGAS